tara:strand:+ start:1036 stop:1254 length:219 start_codon:yes stop_codon:yes gene_type:complete
MKNFSVFLFVSLGTLFVLAAVSALTLGLVTTLVNQLGFWGAVATGTIVSFVHVLCSREFWSVVRSNPNGEDQ